jgi:hypothetical protein
MPKRSSSSKRRPDANERAANVVAIATGQPHRAKRAKRKNPAAVALGRLGGPKGGKARAAALTPEQRSEIAKKAAAARWKDQPQP